MVSHRELDLAVPVSATDHALGPAHAAVTIVECGVRATPTFFVNGTIQDVSFGLHSLADAVKTALEK